MRPTFFTRILSLLLIAIIICATTGGYCRDSHAAEEVICKQCPHDSGASTVTTPDGHSHSCPDADHEGPDHCTSACYCSCHLPVTATGIRLYYAPVITLHLTQETFTPPQDIFLSLFVPPDSASV